MFGVTERQSQLPDNITDLSKFVLVGREKLNAVRAEIRAINKVGLAQEVYQQKLSEAQDIADAVLDAEVRMGQLTAAIPKASGGDRRSENFKSNTADTFEKPKEEQLSEIGMTRQQANRFETLAKHPEAVEKAKAVAREEGRIVTRQDVLTDIRKTEKAAERKAAIEEQINRPKTTTHIDIYNTDKKYRVIYADPPWSYGDRQNTEKLGGAEKHYPTMSIKELCSLPVPSEENAVLFMWVTSPLLEECFEVINAWGFKYKSSFVWDKVAHNMGHYNSVRHEFLLICTKGSCTPDVPKLVDSVISIERTEHSKKPPEFREMIDMLYPAGERLEMFAREAPEGWDVWGNMA